VSSTAAAIWSAIAATFSAIAAITIMRIQHRNMLDSARPELVLTGWDRKTIQQGDPKYEVITFNKIRNVGKGSALHVYINSSKIIHDRPAAVLSTKRLSILPANEEYEINGEITLFWDNVPSDDSGHKYLPIDIQIYSWSSRGYRHETIYTLMAVEPFKNCIFAGSCEIAPGVMLSTRKTISKPVWRLKLNRKLSRLPIAGKYIPKDS
jgi:hypothetical protein